jgi:class 3 adenylate cyclase/tetratricopeptide (TPR) repeat protein
MADDIAEWLSGLGVGKYVETFRANDIDIRAVRYLTEGDLRELGVSLGHRKILVAAIAELGEAARPLTRAEVATSRVTPVAERPDQSEQAERRPLSVLFCDLVGSTGLARRLDPEDMRKLLRSYQDRVAGAITRYGGHVAQYLGDGVMAFFGWPTAFEDQAERAVRAGLEALEAVHSLGIVGGVHVQARVGIATGRVVVGDLSSVGRQEGAIAGETPNLAARIQDCVTANQLVMSEGTRILVGETFEIEDLGTRSLKGFDNAVRLFRVFGVRDVESRFDAARGAVLSRFVGRVHELALLLERWELAKAGEGQIVLISGEAGIGKSRLIRALADRLREEPHVLWRLQCSPYNPNSALFPVIQSLYRAIELRPVDTADDRLDKLERMLRETGENVATLAPIYAELLSFDMAGRYVRREMRPQELKSLTLGALIDRCLLTAAKAPLLLIVEDAHWIDPTTRELIEQTIARIGSARVLTLVSHRPEWQTDWASTYGQVMPLSLGRLAKPQVAELVESMVGRQADETLIAEVTSRTDGVPLFVEELTRSLVERRTGARTEPIEIPATLHGSLMARLDRLPAIAKETIQVASVIGREFSRDMVARVCHRYRAEIDAAVDELITARLVLKGGWSTDTVTFRHALIQDTAYDSLLRSKRQRYHEIIAQMLVEISPETAKTQPELIAHHLTEAGLPGQALPLWRRAGERALARFANDEAVKHFEKAIEVAGQLPDVHARACAVLAEEIRLGQAQATAGRPLEAMATFQGAAELARHANDISALHTCALGFDNAEFLSNEPLDKSVALLNEVLSLLPEGDGHERCQTMTRLARAHAMLGKTENAEQLGRATTEMARRLRDDRSLTEVLIHDFLVPRPISAAQMQAKLARLDELVAAAQRIDDDPGLLGRAFSLEIYLSAEFGDRARMDSALAKYESRSEGRHYYLDRWISRHGRAMQAILDGDFVRAERLAEEAHEMGQRSQGQLVEGVYGMQMFTIRREQGRLPEVAPVIKRLLEDDPHEPAWRPGFALIASDLGYKESAHRVLEALAATGFEFAFDAKRSTTLAYLAEVCASLGDQARAEMLYRLLEPYRDMTITTGILTVCYGSAGRYLGLLATTLAAWDKAEEHFEAALQVNGSMGALPWLAHTQWDYARMLRRRGRVADLERSEVLLSEAWTTANRLDMVALKSRLRGQQH